MGWTFYATIAVAILYTASMFLTACCFMWLILLYQKYSIGWHGAEGVGWLRRSKRPIYRIKAIKGEEST